MIVINKLFFFVNYIYLGILIVSIEFKSMKQKNTISTIESQSFICGSQKDIKMGNRELIGKIIAL